MGESDTSTIDHLIRRKFVTGPPSYRLVMKFAYSMWISMNAENKENTALFDQHQALGHIVFYDYYNGSSLCAVPDVIGTCVSTSTFRTTRGAPR